MDNSRHSTSSNNSDQQSCIVPLNIEFEYENMNNPFHEQHSQQYNAARNSRINNTIPRATIVPLGSGLNYLELTTSNVFSVSRSPIDDPPPSYEECMANSCP